MNATIILNDLSRDKLPPTAMNPRRLFGSLSIHKRPFPHSRLPNELLSYIFLTATHHFEDRYEAILTPITISHVCSRFPTCRSQLSRTMTWLSRSEPYPIDILLDFRDPSWDWDENSHGFHWQDMEAIVRPFLTHVKRWCHVELLTDTWAPIFTFLWYTRRVESAPLLRSISLSRCNAYFASRGAIFHPVQLKEPIPLFGGLALEALRNVSLAGVHLDWARSSLRNLTSLEFKYHARGVMPSLDQFFGILAGCTNLHHLSIIGWGPQLDNAFSYGGNLTEPRNSMQLQHLTSFSFGFIDVNYAVKLLSLFSFPSIEKFMLEDVSFTLDPSENWQDATPILDLLTPRDESGDSSKSLSRSSVGLSLDGIVSLQLHSILSNESAFSHFYSALPNLRKLGLFGTDDALRALNPLSDTGFRSMCPVLQELECRDVDSATLVDVVRSRAETGSVLPLDSITFDSSDEPVRPTLADCLKLRELGIKILYRSR